MFERWCQSFRNISSVHSSVGVVVFDFLKVTRERDMIKIVFDFLKVTRERDMIKSLALRARTLRSNTTLEHYVHAKDA